MTITAYSGPIVSFGLTLSSTSGDGITGQDYEHNEQRAPAFADLGDAMLDPRSAYNYKPGSGVTVQSMGFFNNTGTVDFVPITLNASAFVSASLVTTGVVGAFTLNAASSAGGTFSTTITAPETGKATGTLLAIDSTAAVLAFGPAGTLCVWNPAAGTGRNITIKLSSNLDGGTFSVAGRDMYGYKVTETIATGSTNLVGKKAFKYISSITNASTPTSTGISIGFGDVYGWPLAVPYTGLNTQTIALGSAFGSTAPISLLSSVNVALASTAATQTSTTPDVRGTLTSSVASNGTVRLQMIVLPTAAAIAAITSTNVTPLFGATQFSSV